MTGWNRGSRIFLEPLLSVSCRISISRSSVPSHQRNDDEHQYRVEQHLNGTVSDEAPQTRNCTTGTNSTSMIRSFTDT